MTTMNMAAALAVEEEAERSEFLNRLFTFMAERGTSIGYIPIFDHRELDLWRLYKSVTARGGLSVVVESKLWRQVTAELGVDQERTDAGFRLRMHYLKYLYPFERKFFLGVDDSPLEGAGLGGSPVMQPTPLLPAASAPAGAVVPQSAPPSSTCSAAASPLGAEALGLSPTFLSAAVGDAAAAALPVLALQPGTAAPPLVTPPGPGTTITRRQPQLQHGVVPTPTRGPRPGKKRPRPCVDVGQLDVASLERYRRLYRLKVAAKDQLAAAVVDHFVALEIDEAMAISAFLCALRK